VTRLIAVARNVFVAFATISAIRRCQSGYVATTDVALIKER
jgi:hypothetical protein